MTNKTIGILTIATLILVIAGFSWVIFKKKAADISEAPGATDAPEKKDLVENLKISDDE